MLGGGSGVLGEGEGAGGRQGERHHCSPVVPPSHSPLLLWAKKRHVRINRRFDPPFREEDVWVLARRGEDVEEEEEEEEGMMVV